MDLCARHRLGAGQRGNREPNPIRLLHTRQRQIRHLQPGPAPCRTIHRAQPDEIRAGLLRPGDLRQCGCQIQPELGIDAAPMDRQRHQLAGRRRPQRQDTPRHLIPGDRGWLQVMRRLVARQRRGAIVARGQPGARERPEIAAQRVDRIDPDIRPIIPMAAQRHHLRAKPFHDALRHVPIQRWRARVERHARIHRTRQQSLPGVADGACVDMQLIHLRRRELAADLHLVVVADRHRQIIHWRRHPQHVARLHDVQRRRRGGELQHQPPRLRRVAGGRVAHRDTVGNRVVVAFAAIRIRQTEWRGGAHRNLEDRVVHPRLVRQAQAQRGDPAIRHRVLQHHQHGLRIATIGPLDRAQVEIAGAQGFGAPGGNAGLRLQLDRQQPPKRAQIHRLVEAQRDRIQIRRPVIAVRGPGGGRNRQQRHQRGGGASHRDRLAPQRLPRLGRSELQGGWRQPSPGAGLGGDQRGEPLRMVLPTAIGRPGGIRE